MSRAFVQEKEHHLKRVQKSKHTFNLRKPLVFISNWCIRRKKEKILVFLGATMLDSSIVLETRGTYSAFA